MNFWSFMFFVSLLIPVVMIVFGRMFMKSAPKGINGLFGYRTPMSMKNEDTWEFAHSYVGKLWFYGGIILLVITIIIMSALVKKDAESLGNYDVMLVIAQVICLAIPVFPTEKALKKNFDEQGNKR